MSTSGDEHPIDFSTLKYSFHSFRAISGGLRKGDCPDLSLCSPIKLTKHHSPEDVDHFPKMANNPQQTIGPLPRIDDDGTLNQHAHILGPFSSNVVHDDYISTNFKWANFKDTQEVTNTCPRSFDVAGDCPVCKNSSKKSKLHWRSIYEVNLSSSVPLIAEVKDGRALEESLLLMKSHSSKSKVKAKPVVDSQGRTSTKSSDSPPTVVAPKTFDGRQVSWQRPATAGSQRGDDLPAIRTLVPERPQTSEGQLERTSSSVTSTPPTRTVNRGSSNNLSRSSSNTLRVSVSRQSSAVSRTNSKRDSPGKSRQSSSSIAAVSTLTSTLMDATITSTTANANSIVPEDILSSPNPKKLSNERPHSSVSHFVGVSNSDLNSQHKPSTQHTTPATAGSVRFNAHQIQHQKSAVHHQQHPSLTRDHSVTANSTEPAPLLGQMKHHKSFVFTSGRKPLVISSSRGFGLGFTEQILQPHQQQSMSPPTHHHTIEHTSQSTFVTPLSTPTKLLATETNKSIAELSFQ